MATELKSRRRRRKKILRKNDGSLYDATERRRITQAELRDYVRDGGLFEARRQENGADCTYEVLTSVMGTGLMENLVPGLGGGAHSRLGGLSALAGGGPLAALGGGGGLGDLARLIADQVAPGGDRDDDWDEPRRRPRSRRSGEWDRDDGWSEGRSRRAPDDPTGRGDGDREDESATRRGQWRDSDWADPDVE